jgi:GT2 family glycosyltransferase
LNDDVFPINQSWLDVMANYAENPKVGIVGAKLYYPNDTVQHGGVLMGIGGLCEHMNRFLPRNASGYTWRGSLSQDLSAVTGACLLIKRQIYDRLGGLDESYESAFSDVDLCLRVREEGKSIVFAADAELYHLESASYGSHYAGDRAGLEAIDVKRMRDSWSSICAADPFHNPNLDLIRGNEWGLAFPPRHLGQAIPQG